MVLDELLERAVMVSKVVWRKQGDEISQHDVKRIVATTRPATEEDDAG